MRLANIFTSLMILIAVPAPVSAASVSSYERRIESAEREASEKKRELRERKSELGRAKQELARMAKKSKEDKAEQEAKVANLASEVRGLEGELRAAAEGVSDLEDARDRAETREREQKMAKAKAAMNDCAACAAARTNTPNQNQQSTWDGISQVVKAITPLGIAGMGTWLNYQGMQQQSNNYQFYANSMLSQGLPISAPTSFFGNSAGTGMSVYGNYGGFSTASSFSMGYGYPSYLGSIGAGSYLGYGFGMMPSAYPNMNSGVPTVASAYRL